MLSKNILLISGFDATASAGILLDSYIVKYFNCFPYCVVPAFSIQNHLCVRRHIKFSLDDLKLQLESIDFIPHIIKIGLLHNEEAIILISQFLKKFNVKIILDTPIISSSGKQLVEDVESYVGALKKYLLPMTYLITPNLEEINFFGSVEEILKIGCNAVLVKGGHLYDEMCTDALYSNTQERYFSMPRILFDENIRGTGCGLSTAISCFLVKGYTLENAIEEAKKFIFNGIKNSVKINGTTRVMQFI